MQVQTFEQEDYSGGLNDTASPRDINRNEASVLRNWDITFMGKLKRRDGLTLVGSSTSNPIAGLAAFIRNSGSDLLRVQGGNIDFLNGSSWQTLDNTLTAGRPVFMENVQSLGRIYMGNQDNALRYWDRVSTTLDASVTTVTNTIAANSVPHGNIMRWHKNYMFQLNNVNVSGTIYSNEVYFSALGDPNSYDTTNDHFSVPGDGRVLTAIDLGTNLVFFKERAIQYLTGWGPTSWRLTSQSTATNINNISEEVGICGAYAATRVGDEVWFMDNQGFIRRLTRTEFDFLRHDIICTKIMGTLGTLNKSQLSQVFAWAWNNKVYFAVPTGTSVVCNTVLVFDILAAKRITQSPYFLQEAWTTYTGWNVSFFCDLPTSGIPTFYIGDALTGNVYKHIGVDDNGVAINAQWDSKDDHFNKPDSYKRFRWGDLRGTTTGAALNVDIYTSIGLTPYAHAGALSLQGSGSKLGPTGSFRLGPTGNATLGGAAENHNTFIYTAGGGTASGKTVRHSFRHNVAGQQPIINTYTCNYKLKDPRYA